MPALNLKTQAALSFVSRGEHHPPTPSSTNNGRSSKVKCIHVCIFCMSNTGCSCSQGSCVRLCATDEIGHRMFSLSNVHMYAQDFTRLCTEIEISFHDRTLLTVGRGCQSWVVFPIRADARRWDQGVLPSPLARSKSHNKCGKWQVFHFRWAGCA